MISQLLTVMTIVELLVGSLNINVPVVEEPQKMRVTCYTWTGNRTSSGVYPEEGMCASNYSNLGKYAMVYDLEMNFIGTFRATDTGGAKSLKNGTSIDIYRDNLSRCHSWVNEYGDYLIVVWVSDD